MYAEKILTDVRIWVISGIILGLAIGIENPGTSAVLTAVLIAQMTMALHGLKFSAQDLRNDAKGTVTCLLCCYLLN